MAYRLVIDIELGDNQEKAIITAKSFMDILSNHYELYDDLLLQMSGLKLGYRLSNDEDRSKKNYLDINENGHASSGKFTFEIK